MRWSDVERPGWLCAEKGKYSSLTTVSLYKFCGSETWVAAYLGGYKLGFDDAELAQASRKRSLVGWVPGRVRTLPQAVGDLAHPIATV